MNREEIRRLEQAIEQMMDLARGFGLDFYEMRFEICPADIVYTFGAYGMPTRFSHWSFGKAFHRMKTQYDFGLSRIYELVINSDPCYAFLLDGNSLLQNKLVAAHVLAHCDFFKNNAHFAHTSRFMVESMASSAERIRSYELQYGKDVVEQFLDAALAIQEHVDPSVTFRRRPRDWEERREKGQQTEKPGSPYDDLWALDRPPSAAKQTEMAVPRKIPPEPEKDLVLFLIEHSRVLEDWQRDILSVLRDEMLYFWPQIETKIMNEGWATYWHLRIMREMDLTSDEAVDFSQMHSGVVLPSKTSINPYYVGLAIWEDIEKRWNDPPEEARRRFGARPGQGRAKMFEVRETETDTSFLRNYLTKELVEELNLYLYQKMGSEWRVVETDWEKVRDTLCAARVNGGFPVILVQDGDYLQNGELYLTHRYEGVELDVKYVEKTLPYVYRLWGRPVHLETVLDSRAILFSYDGKKNHRKFL
ncbi:SpoVR family protein [Kyrpidia spormannii]|uniref:Involved in spore cortex synthesis (stage V sporulation, conserved in non sporulating bacteria) n=2 Tax=Kyrpidia spormannii TaxID=2055160 RepID=A0ACA8ZER6_9BACL|nr:SpoVR family protein [Kyrpidia spormannii]CAB3394113.1 involved in spore cortex synthesis (stage V sporulation, conserved in non sporulating bacteria [Kyrpidia spormannii]CAB3395047.1 involved in spore cortex synthesis (stage V sporulation, conserved in non sporulating bacteria [Kyrpidia spormannii]